MQNTSILGGKKTIAGMKSGLSVPCLAAEMEKFIHNILGAVFWRENICFDDFLLIEIGMKLDENLLKPTANLDY